MRRNHLPILLGTFLMVALAVAAVPGARAADGEADAAPVPAAVEDSAAARDGAGECLVQPVVEPILLAAPAQTCEECQADCQADSEKCINQCIGRDCPIKCWERQQRCLSRCPC